MSELKVKLSALIEKAYQTEPKEMKKVAREILLALPKEAGICEELDDYLNNSSDPRELFDILPAVKRFIESYSEKPTATVIDSDRKFDIKQSMREIGAAANAPVSLGVVDIIPTPEVNKRTDAMVIDFANGEVIECGEAEPITEPIGEYVDPDGAA